MNTETEIEMNDTDLVAENDENDSELNINNDDIIPNNSLTNEVKELIEQLVIEERDHNERQRGFFEALLRLWFGDNAVRSIKNNQEHTERLIHCKKFVCQMIAKYLPAEDNHIYSAYYSLQKDGKCEVYDGDVYKVTYVKDIDMKEFSKHVYNIKRKVVNQFNILVKNFQLYLTEIAERDKLMEERDKLIKVRLPTQREVKKTTNFGPFLKWITTKKINELL